MENLEKKEKFARYLLDEYRSAERVYNRHCPLDIQVCIEIIMIFTIYDIDVSLYNIS